MAKNHGAYVRDGMVRTADTAVEAVQLEAAGWVKVRTGPPAEQAEDKGSKKDPK